MSAGLFRSEAKASYVNADTRGSLLSVAPPSVKGLLLAASLALFAAAAIAGFGRVRVSVDGRGVLRPSDPAVAVLAYEGTHIRVVRCAAGDEVHRGDVLFDLDVSEPRAGLDACERSVGRSRDTLAAAQKQLDDWLRQPAPQEAIAYLLETRVQRASEILDEQETRCASLRKRATTVTITSPMDGTIATVAAHAGPAQTGETLATVLPSTATLRAYLRVPESDVGRIAEGTDVLLRFDAYPDETYGMGEGKVLHVLVDASEDEQATVEVALLRAPAAAKTRSGLKFSASIVTGERSIASLLVPR